MAETTKSEHMDNQAIKPANRSRDAMRAMTAVKDAFSAAECYHSTSARVDESLRRLRARFNLPQYFWAKVDGYRECKTDTWYRHLLVHCYVINGEVVACNWDAMTEEQREYCRKGLNTVGGQWWKDDQGKPIVGRPFYVFLDKRLQKDPVTGHYPLSEDVTDQYCAK